MNDGDEGLVCIGCHTWANPGTTVCPGCGETFILSGEAKNVIDRLEPDCLIHRYEGSDLLEPAAIIREGRTNIKVAIRLREYAAPVTVAKTKAYKFDHDIFCAIQGLRNERKATIGRYDMLIQNHWNHLKPYYDQT